MVQGKFNFNLIFQKMIDLKILSSKNRKKLEPQGIERGRTLTRLSSITKYGAAQAGANFRGRKSNSLMNLCGGKKKKILNFELFFFFDLFDFSFVGLSLGQFDDDFVYCLREKNENRTN